MGMRRIPAAEEAEPRTQYAPELQLQGVIRRHKAGSGRPHARPYLTKG